MRIFGDSFGDSEKKNIEMIEKEKKLEGKR